MEYSHYNSVSYTFGSGQRIVQRWHVDNHLWSLHRPCVQKKTKINDKKYANRKEAQSNASPAFALRKSIVTTIVCGRSIVAAIAGRLADAIRCTYQWVKIGIFDVHFDAFNFDGFKSVNKLRRLNLKLNIKNSLN